MFSTLRTQIALIADSDLELPVIARKNIALELMERVEDPEFCTFATGSAEHEAEKARDQHVVEIFARLDMSVVSKFRYEFLALLEKFISDNKGEAVAPGLLMAQFQLMESALSRLQSAAEKLLCEREENQQKGSKGSNGSKESNVEILRATVLKINRQLQKIREFSAEDIAVFEESAYLDVFPDVAIAIENEEIADALFHYIQFGADEILAGHRKLSHDNPVLGWVVDREQRCLNEVRQFWLDQREQIQEDESEDERKSACDDPSDKPGSDQSDIKEVRDSGLIDESWYKRHVGQVDDVADHYFRIGSLLNVKPNCYFDPVWYAIRFMGERPAGPAALLHFIRYSAMTGSVPGPEWGDSASDDEKTVSLSAPASLRNLLKSDPEDKASPNAVFDAGWYAEKYPDVESSGMPLAQHYHEFGWLENRGPSADFDTAFYKDYVDIDGSGLSPMGHYLRIGNLLGYPTNEQQGKIFAIRRSGLFDKQWYRSQISVEGDELTHYIETGSYQLIKPNYLFDPVWYGCEYLDGKTTGPDVLSHYISDGARQGFAPSPLFEPGWYVEQHKAEGVSLERALTHFMAVGRFNGSSPNSLFDTRWYSEKYRDVALTYSDPFFHYCSLGWLEERSPSKSFDVEFYKKEYLDNNGSVNPVAHYLSVADRDTVFTNYSEYLNGVVADVDLSTVSRNIKYFSNPGNLFENAMEPQLDKQPEVSVIAFYLPQFHAFEENDEWWGTGFTEWRNVSRGSPRFEGHYQPRIPRDLGHYDLNREEVLIQQSEIALNNGVEAFCFYYYWFNGKRLMHKPLDMFADSTKISQQFCIMWANENWTRTWDGFDSEVLIEQEYRVEDEDNFITDTARYFRNERYRKINGRPLFILYRPNLVPHCKSTINRWRTKWFQETGMQPMILMVQGFGEDDPRKFGLDGAVEFPPHKVAQGLPNIGHKMNILDSDYHGTVVSYDDVIDRSLADYSASYPLFKTVVPSWDNDARREGRGYTMHGSTPQKYQRWLRGAIDIARANPVQNESIVFVNAWNEWAEATYLEPDVHYGHAYLNATQKAVRNIREAATNDRILLVGHDAHTHGAQLLLLNIAKTMSTQFGIEVFVILLNSGSLITEYKKHARVLVCHEENESSILEFVRSNRLEQAVTNTSVTGIVAGILAREGLEVISLVHELPKLITEYGLQAHLAEISQYSKHVIFASDLVRDGYHSIVGASFANTVVKPQGLYKLIGMDKVARGAVRESLGIGDHDKLVLNVGFADLRKGFDLFINRAKQVIAADSSYHFLWLGGIEDELGHWIVDDLEDEFKRNIHFVKYTEDVGRYYSASDIFFLTSREDPYPSVVLEALAVGLPIVAFRNATGMNALAEAHGLLLDPADHENLHTRFEALLASNSEEKAAERILEIQDNYRFDEYCFELLSRLDPELKKISVVVPNYNYARHMVARLESVFNQKYPIFEVVILDDCSTDDSIEVIDNYLASTNRVARFVKNMENSGNTFRQWEKGLNIVKGDYIWIAEADDLCSDNFLAQTSGRMGQGVCMTFTNSAQINEEGNPLASSYDYYYREFAGSLFDNEFVMNGSDFVEDGAAVRNPILNVSSVLWNTDALRSAVEQVGSELFNYKIVGDWILYLVALGQAGAKIAYIPESLNIHRRHGNSVTHATESDRHLQEVESVHRLIRESIGENVAVSENMEQYVRELENQFGIRRSDRIDDAA